MNRHPPVSTLFPTPTLFRPSRHSRNRWAGEQIGLGRSVDEIIASTPKVVEGIPATRAAVQLGARYGVDLPVCTQVDRVVNHGADRKSTRLNSSHANISYAVF